MTLNVDRWKEFTKPELDLIEKAIHDSIRSFSSDTKPIQMMAAIIIEIAERKRLKDELHES